MKSHFLFITGLVLLIVFQNCSKKENVISIGKQDRLRSKILSEQRDLLIYVPSSYESDTTARYPVVYLLDGDSHFHSVTGILDQLSANEICPKMIVVGIPNTDRSRDLTPTRSPELPGGGQPDFLKTTGGGENFTAFLEKELFPYVESHYRTAPHRILIGHSFGGLFAINTLLKHSQMFDSYLAIDPSLWWDDYRLLMESNSILANNNFEGKTLFISAANTMQPGMDTLRARSDTTGATVHIRAIINFSKLAAAASAENGLNFAWKYYDEDSHGSVPLISEYDALRFMFGFYRLPLDAPYLTVDKVVDHYRHVSEKLGYVYLPPEGMVNEVGHYFMRDKAYEQAFVFFDLNIRNYPQSQNVYGSMGDYYVAVADNRKAIEYFNKALAFGDSEATRKKLVKLEHGNKVKHHDGL
jgi:predicted alpha/beta superfamily hydrolase